MNVGILKNSVLVNLYVLHNGITNNKITCLPIHSIDMSAYISGVKQII